MSTWVTIQTFTFPSEAYTAKAKLESCGIDAFLKDEMTTQVINIYSNAIGGVKLQVEQVFVEEARKILIEGGFMEGKETPTTKRTIEVLDIEAYPDKTKCPFCQSDNIDTIVHPNILVILFYFILGVIFPIFKSWNRCYDCYREWKYKKLKKKIS